MSAEPLSMPPGGVAIRGAFQHLPGIGPERLKRLRAAGVRSWDELLASPPAGLRLGPKTLAAVATAVRRAEQAVAANDLQALAQTLAGPDRWRLLAHAVADASFMDIETTGLDWQSEITLVAFHHRGRLHTFVRGENLEGALDLLDDIRLLVSFNGASFDVPRLLRAFHVPELPCPHLDLRWICHHEGLHGGLKSIEARLGLGRPRDVEGVDGALAVWLWNQWVASGDATARGRLLRYCCADVLALRFLTLQILQRHGCGLPPVPAAECWNELDERFPAGGSAAASRPEPAPSPAAAPLPPPETSAAAPAAPGSEAEALAALRRRLEERWRQFRSQPRRTPGTTP